MTGTANGAGPRVVADRLRRLGVEPGLLAVVALFALGAGLRLWFLAAYRPAFMGYADSASYAVAAQRDVFLAFRAAGYPIFLRLAHLVSADLSFTVGVQHLLGITTAALLYLSVRRLGGARWSALVPAGVVLIDGVELFLEHAVLAETLFTFTVVAALYAAIRGLDVQPVGWSAAAGLCLGAATTIRPVAVALLPVMALWRVSRPPPWRAALGPAAALCTAGALVFVVYQAAQVSATGQVGLTRAEGWIYYGRTAPFADCRRFRPPTGTRALCESSEPEDRGDANYYLWDRRSPANRLFGPQPNGNERLRAFARAAVVHQPLDYLEAVGQDLGRYVSVDWASDGLVHYLQHRENERAARSAAAAYYSFAGYEREGADELSRYATKFNFSGRPTGVLIALAALAPLVLRGRAQRGALLFSAVGLTLLVAPVLTLFSDIRYAIPAYGPLAAAAALGLDALAAIVRSRGRRWIRPTAVERRGRDSNPRRT